MSKMCVLNYTQWFIGNDIFVITTNICKINDNPPIIFKILK